MGRTVLITGASRNIGRTLALRYAEAGYAVVVNSRRPGPIDDVRREIETSGGQAMAHVCDVRDRRRSKRWLQQHVTPSAAWMSWSTTPCYACTNRWSSPHSRTGTR